MCLECLPTEIFCKVLAYLSYEEASTIRKVCKKFDGLCGMWLNQGFRKVQLLQGRSLKRVRSELPRRESERRKHLLYPKQDALMGLDTRISLLKMTYNRYIIGGQCCFIPGKVLDELYNVLNKINTSDNLPSSMKLLQEVRDISSMAMEHFDEVVLPTIQKNNNESFPPCSCTFIHSPTEIPESPVKTRNFESRSRAKLKSKLLSQKNKNFKLQRKLQRESMQKSKKIEFLEKKVKRHDNSLKDCKSQIAEMRTQLQTLQSLLTPYSLPPSEGTSRLNLTPDVSKEQVTKTVSIKRHICTEEPSSKIQKLK